MMCLDFSLSYIVFFLKNVDKKIFHWLKKLENEKQSSVFSCVVNLQSTNIEKWSNIFFKRLKLEF